MEALILPLIIISAISFYAWQEYTRPGSVLKPKIPIEDDVMGLFTKIKNTLTFAKAGWETKTVDAKAISDETYQQINMLLNLIRNKNNGKLPNSVLHDYYLIGYLVRFTFLLLSRKGISNESLLRFTTYLIVSRCIEIKPDMLMKIIAGMDNTEEFEYGKGTMVADTSMIAFESRTGNFILEIMSYLNDKYKLVC
jgi:hypothetical protein